MSKQVKISILSTFILSILIFVIAAVFIIKYNRQVSENQKLNETIHQLALSNDQYQTKIEELNAEIADIKAKAKESVEQAIADSDERVEAVKTGFLEYIRQNSGYDTVEDFCKGYKEQQALNDTYLEKIDEMNLVITDLIDKMEKYEHYEYALFDTSGKRNDITMQDIELLEQLTFNEPVNDVDLYLSWIMIESEGYAMCKNPNSTAKGLAQFLDGTSKSVYRSLDFDDAWYPEIVYKKDICLTMMVKYVNDLMRSYNGDLNKTIISYRGLYDGPYMNLFNKYLAKSGKSIDYVAQESLKRYKQIKEMENVAVG